MTALIKALALAAIIGAPAYAEEIPDEPSSSMVSESSEETSQATSEETSQATSEGKTEASSEATSESESQATSETEGGKIATAVNEAEEWLKEFFTPETIALIMSLVAYLSTIVGLAANLKRLKREKNLTIESVQDAVLKTVEGKLGENVEKELKKYLPTLTATADRTNRALETFAKILALAQENSPEARVAILNLVQELGAIGGELAQGIKEGIEAEEAEKEAKAEESRKALDAIIEDDGTSV